MLAKLRGKGQGEDEDRGAKLRPKRRRRVPTEDGDPQKGGEETATPDSTSQYERRYFWSHHTESGFPNRVNHAVAVCGDPSGDYSLYSLGGYHADDDERTVIQADTMGGPFFRSSPIDVHCLDVDGRTWTRIDPPPPEKYVSTGPYQRAKIPGCRYGHTVCHYRGQLYMYGGRNDEDGSFSTVECYDLATNVWLKLLCAGDAPSSRDGHACAQIGSEMFIHGGFSAREIRFSGDLFAFNMASHTWRKLPTEGDYVRERDFHTTTAVNNRIVTFGGRSDMFAPFFTANDVYDDVFYCYDMDVLKWQKMPTTGYKVIGRRSHCAANLGNNIIYFGGYNAQTKQHFGDVFILNTDTCHITEIRPFGSAPLPRRRVGAALAGTELIICGGTSPVEVMRKGKTREILHDHNDMYILQLLPTLQQCCLTYIIQEKVDYSPLPTFMQERIDTIKNMPIQTVTSAAQYESG